MVNGKAVLETSLDTVNSYTKNIMEQNDRILCHDLIIRIELGRLSLSTFFRYYIHILAREP